LHWDTIADVGPLSLRIKRILERASGHRCGKGRYWNDGRDRALQFHGNFAPGSVEQAMEKLRNPPSSN
jgi:hypothetical protein